MKAIHVMAISLLWASAAVAGERSALLPPSYAMELLAQCSRATPSDLAGVWVVPHRVIAELEADLPKLSKLKSTQCCGSGSVVHPETFYRQYAGVVIHGRKYVYINAMDGHPIYFKEQDRDAWRKKPMIACDGGQSLWGALYDPETRTFSQLAFNGPA